MPRGKLGAPASGHSATSAPRKVNQSKSELRSWAVIFSLKMVVNSYSSASDGQTIFWRNQLRRSGFQPVQGGFNQGLVFAQSAPGSREFDYQVPCGDAQNGAAQKDRHPQSCRLPIGRRGRNLMLIEAQQVEGEQNGQKGRFGRKEGAQAEAVNAQIVLEFFNALLDGSPSIVIVPQLQRAVRPVGHPHPEGVARHLQEPTPKGGLVFPNPLPDHHKAPGLGPSQQLEVQLGNGQIRIDDCTVIDTEI